MVKTDSVGARELAIAIVRQACIDYSRAWAEYQTLKDREEYLTRLDEMSRHPSITTIEEMELLSKEKATATISGGAIYIRVPNDSDIIRLQVVKGEINECERFFRGDWYEQLCELEPEFLMRECRKGELFPRDKTVYHYYCLWHGEELEFRKLEDMARFLNASSHKLSGAIRKGHRHHGVRVWRKEWTS